MRLPTLLFIVILFYASGSPNTLEAQQNSLPILNAQRASLGIYPLRLDLQLQAHAENEIRAMYRRGEFAGHIKGKWRRGRRGRGTYSSKEGFAGHMEGKWRGAYPGTGEGVGRRSLNDDPYGYRFYTCFQATQEHRYAGAATIVRDGKRYYILLVK